VVVLALMLGAGAGVGLWYTLGRDGGGAPAGGQTAAEASAETSVGTGAAESATVAPGLEGVFRLQEAQINGLAVDAEAFAEQNLSQVTIELTARGGFAWNDPRPGMSSGVGTYTLDGDKLTVVDDRGELSGTVDGDTVTLDVPNPDDPAVMTTWVFARDTSGA
jgi:hypothetical protein